MERGVIEKGAFPQLVAAVAEDADFMGPVQRAEGVILAKLGTDDEVAFSYANTLLPAKRHFFPQSEVIYTYEGDVADAVPMPEGKTVLFGLRPCDALALVHLDKVFLDEQYVDPYYGARRENTVVISLACAEPAETCFCTSVGGSPAGTDGADAIAFDLGDSVLFESATKEGAEFVKRHKNLLKKPKADQVKAAEKMAKAAEKRVPSVDVADIAGKLRAVFESAAWDTIAERCLGCGVCTYSCPTCHCFGIYDEKRDTGGRRIRAQDGCMFPMFTLEASGHNPRSTTGERMRQRIMHKFRYTVENFGAIFCVGCGRCIIKCPVNMDVREVLSEATR